jgi:glycosyltransferase involved in cell wall biosynthesis
MPLISIITPAYNASKFIAQTIECVLAQSFVDWEMIIVDDGSTDETALVIKPFLKDKRIKYFYQENGKQSKARNHALRYAKGEYIAFLDADDSWHPKKIEIQYGLMMSNQKIALSFHRSQQIESIESLVFDLAKSNMKSLTFRSLLLSNYVPTRSVMLKKSLPQRFYPGKRHAEDYLLWLKIAYAEGGIWFTDLVLSYSYKRDFGEGGLNSFLYKSHVGVLDTYKKILADRLISHFT